MRDNDPFRAVFGVGRGPLPDEIARLRKAQLDSDYGFFLGELQDLANVILQTAIAEGDFEESFFRRGSSREFECPRLYQPHSTALTYVMPEVVLLRVSYDGWDVRPWEWAGESALRREDSYRFVLALTASTCGVETKMERTVSEDQLRSLSPRWCRVLRARRRRLAAGGI